MRLCLRSRAAAWLVSCRHLNMFTPLVSSAAIPADRVCRLFGTGIFQYLQPLVEVAGIDRPDEGVDHLAQLERLVGRDGALRCRLHDRPHRRRDVGSAVYWRHGQLDRPFAARRDDAVETEPQRSLAAAESELDGLPAKCFGLAIEKRFRGERCVIARAARAPRRIARPALFERPSRPPYWLFLQRIYSHAHLLCGKAAFPGRHLAAEYDNNLAIS